MIIALTVIFVPIILAVVGSIWVFPLRGWYDFWIPLAILVTMQIASIILWLLYIFIVGSFITRKTHDKANKWVKFWLEQGEDFLLFFVKAKIVVRGLNKIPQSQRFLLVCNHRSNYDPMVLAHVLKKYDLAFITKKSNLKIPFFGKFLFGAAYYPVDREDKTQSLEMFKRAEHLITNNYGSMCIFPEGTRQQDHVLIDFHEGVFNIALHSKCPIVVATVKGTDKIRKRFVFRTTRVELDFLGVLNPEDIEAKPAKEVSDEVRKIMYDHLERINILDE